MPRKEFNVKIKIKKKKINSNPLISRTFFVFKKNARAFESIRVTRCFIFCQSKASTIIFGLGALRMSSSWQKKNRGRQFVV